MCEGVTRGLAGEKLSASRKKLGSNRTNHRRDIINNEKPRTSLIV